MPRIQDFGAFSAVREAGLAKLVPAVPRIAVGMGTCGRGNGAEGLYSAFSQAIELTDADLVLAPVGCFGACFQEPLVSVRLPGNPLVVLRHVQPNDAARVLHDLTTGNLSLDLIYCKIEEWARITGHARYGQGYSEVPSWSDVTFFKGQKKIVLRNCGIINPDDIEEYRRIDLVYRSLVDAQEFRQDVDVTLVEGAVSSQDDLNKIQKIRQRAAVLISLGDCAVTGNVSGCGIPSPRTTHG